jgi:hypothetical protein
MGDEEVRKHHQSDPQDEGNDKTPPAILMSLEVTANHGDKHTDPNAQISQQQNSPPGPFSKWLALHCEKLKHVGMHEWVMVFATVVMATSTIAYTTYSSKQVSVMRETLTEMKRESNIAYRPWIGPESAIVVQSANLGAVPTSAPKAIFSVRNYGNGPAIRVFDGPMSIVYFADSGQLYRTFENLSDLACALGDPFIKGAKQVSVSVNNEPKITVPIPIQLGQVLFPTQVLTSPPSSMTLAAKGGPTALMGCIGYLGQSDSAIHHTRYCFMSQVPIDKVSAGQQLVPCPIFQKAN